MARNSHMLDHISGRRWYINEKGEKVTFAAVHYRVNTVSYLVCTECGDQVSTKDLKGQATDFTGRVCPKCGKVIGSQGEVLELESWYSTRGQQFHSYDFDPKTNTIIKTTRAFKLVSTGERLWAIEQSPDEISRIELNQLGNHNVPSTLKDTILEKYGDKIAPILKILLKSKSSYARNYYDKLKVAQDLYDNAPALFDSLLDAIRGDALYGKHVTFDMFESLYPEYLLPLTPKLIKDYNPMDGMRYHYSKKEWNKPSVYHNYEAVTYVVNMYKAELISFNMMYNLLQNIEALDNPMFVTSFKRNFMQMDNYISEIKFDGKDPRTAPLDLKTHYWENSMQFFRDQGYTAEQVDMAFSGEGRMLQKFIKMGETRRLRGAKAAAKKP